MNATLTEWLSKQSGVYDLYSPQATVDSLCSPLLYQPGTSFAYSNGLDWVGVLIERISGMSLEDYFSKHIFEPCGITSMTFYPTEAILEHKMSVCRRAADGKILLTEDGWGCKRPHKKEDVHFLTAGGGLYGNQRDWLRLCRHILRCHPKYLDLSPILSPDSYELLFTPALNMQQSAKAYELIAAPNYIRPAVTADTVNHSMGIFLILQDCEGARRKNSGGWHGMAQTQFWIDPTSGIAVWQTVSLDRALPELIVKGVCATQLLTTPPDPWFEVYREFERRLYAELDQ